MAPADTHDLGDFDGSLGQAHDGRRAAFDRAIPAVQATFEVVVAGPFAEHPAQAGKQGSIGRVVLRSHAPTVP